MRVNRIKAVLLAATALGALAGGVLAENFTWTGVAAGLGNAGFGEDCNWHPGPTCVWPDRYPDGTDDNAKFPPNLFVAWTVDLITETIGDLTIEENVDFGSASGSVTLEVNQLVIDGSTGDVTVSADSDATIKSP